MITMTSAEAQDQFGQLLDTVQREPVAITRGGQPAAYVLSPQDLEELKSLNSKRRDEIAADWQAWRDAAKKSMTPEAEKLTDEDVVRMVHELR
jgi:antitoxin Phd